MKVNQLGRLHLPKQESQEMSTEQHIPDDEDTTGSPENQLEPQEYNLLNYKYTDPSVNKGEANIPISTIHENTATFRAKENSHYNAYDLNDQEMNSLIYHHASSEREKVNLTSKNFVSS